MGSYLRQRLLGENFMVQVYNFGHFQVSWRFANRLSSTKHLFQLNVIGPFGIHIEKERVYADCEYDAKGNFALRTVAIENGNTSKSH